MGGSEPGASSGRVTASFPHRAFSRFGVTDSEAAATVLMTTIAGRNNDELGPRNLSRTARDGRRFLRQAGSHLSRDGLELSGFPEPLGLAREILRVLEAREAAGTLDPWDLATAAEACVALGETREALQWILRYVRPGTDAFSLASTLRQLMEVWQLDASREPGASLLPFLRSQLLDRIDRKGGRVDLEAGELRTSLAHPEDEGFEKILGHDRTVTLRWYRTGLDRCLAVARIETRAGKGVGTGFLVRGGDLHPSLEDELVLLTNAHVVSNDPMAQVKGALHPQKAVVTFEMLDGGAGSKVEHRIARLLWSSPQNLLDAALLRLDPPVRGIEPYPIAPPPLPDADGKRRVYIIGHPGGRSLEISLHDNLLLDAEDPKLHYRAPTERGSSGSPVFDQDWDLVGLHHSGRLDMPRLRGQEGTYAANEAIWIQAILSAPRAGVGASGQRTGIPGSRAGATPGLPPASRKTARDPREREVHRLQAASGRAP